MIGLAYTVHGAGSQVAVYGTGPPLAVHCARSVHSGSSTLRDTVQGQLTQLTVHCEGLAHTVKSRVGFHLWQ